jgi:urease gamma subunit
MTNPEARTLVAAKILECASSGNQTHDLLLDTGRRAVIDQSGNVDAVRKFFR